MAIGCLVDVTPKYAAHVGESIHHLKQLVRVAQPDAVEPAAAHGYGLVVDADQRMLGGVVRQAHLQELQLGPAQPPAIVARVMAVQQYQ